jgi:hypothetical protein
MTLSEEMFSLLQGQWQLERFVSGHRRMKGIASFVAYPEDPQTLLYREDGQHIPQDGASFSFFREYVYCLNQIYVDVYFSHSKKRSRFFHRLLFSGNSQNCEAVGEHSCGNDMYAATYQFFELKRFIVRYDICGPKKNLTIQTFFQR